MTAPGGWWPALTYNRAKYRLPQVESQSFRSGNKIRRGWTPNLKASRGKVGHLITMAIEFAREERKAGKKFMEDSCSKYNNIYSYFMAS